ncbi:MAG: DNA polymerase III subunit epsilon, partial [Tardiphaga sp.]
ELLAEVYIDLVGARQSSLILAEDAPIMVRGGNGDTPRRQREVALLPRLTDHDRASHRAFVGTLGDKQIWSEFWGEPEPAA